MANSFNEYTNVWKVDSAAALSVDSSLSRPVVVKVYYIPNAAGDDLVLQDGDQSEDAIVLKAKSGNTNPVCLTFPNGGRRIANLTCSTIDGGTAYVYIK